MISKFEEKNREYYVLKSHLNQKTLQQTLNRNPKIMVINCHGSINEKRETTFWFEDKDQPAIVDSFSEERLRELVSSNQLRSLKDQVRLVIISACHSSFLAEILVDAGIPSVVSISASS